MARDMRLRRDLPIDIDLSALQRIAIAAQANHKQYVMAYSRALNRTAATLRKRAMADIKSGLAPRSLAMVRKRLLSFRLSRGSELDEMKIWFGLNKMKVKDLKGKVVGRIRPHHSTRDPATGRYSASDKKGVAPSFQPSGKLIPAQAYDKGEVGRTKRGQKTIFVRDADSRRATEAEVDIYEPMLNFIEDSAFADVAAIFMHHFETDLKGRVKAKINLN